MAQLDCFEEFFGRHDGGGVLHAHCYFPCFGVLCKLKLKFVEDDTAHVLSCLA
jgi:hypothetical protein